MTNFPLEKCQFFDFFKFLFLVPRKAFFRSRILWNTFSWPILSKKKKLEKWPHLEQNHDLIPLEKCPFFHFFNFLFLLPRNEFFRSRISWNTFYLPLLSKKKKLEKWPIFKQNHGLTPLEKCQFFDLLNFFFLLPTNAFLRSRISYKTFFWPILPKKNNLEKWPILEHNHGLTPLKNVYFFGLLQLLGFIA